MKKEQVLARLKEDCLVAVVRAKNLEQGEKVIDAIIEGGINFIEICMTVDEGSPIDLIANMVAKYKDNEKIVIGAGTDVYKRQAVFHYSDWKRGTADCGKWTGLYGCGCGNCGDKDQHVFLLSI